MSLGRPETDVDAADVQQWIAELDEQDCTVGYGDRYQHPDDADIANGLVVHQNNSATGVSHVGDAEYGFDLTGFGDGLTGATNFIRVLETVGLHPYYDYVRVFRDLGRGKSSEYGDYYLYVWSNDDVMVACCVNPITGETGDPHMSGPRVGYGSYMAVGGNQPEAGEAFDAVREYATDVKDYRRDGLFF